MSLRLALQRAAADTSRAVADRQATEYRDAQAAQPLQQDVRRADGAAGVRGRGELTDGNARQSPEDAAVTQMGQHAVNPISGLVDFFDEQDGTGEVRHERRTDRGIEYAQVTAEQQALRTARGPYTGGRRTGIGLEQYGFGTHQHLTHTADEQTTAFQLRSDGPVNGRQARMVP